MRSRLLDLVMLVLGVFLGVEAGNWNAARTDRADARVFLENFHRELKDGQPALIRVREARRETLDDLRVASFIAPRTRYLDDMHSFCFSLALSHVLYVSRPELPSLVDLESVGRVGIVDDDELRTLLNKLRQSSSALDRATRDLQPLAVNFPQKYPGVFLLRSLSGGDETDLRGTGTCNFGAVNDIGQLGTDITVAADVYDAFIREGFDPWVSAYEATLLRVEELLGENGDEEAASSSWYDVSALGWFRQDRGDR